MRTCPHESLEKYVYKDIQMPLITLLISLCRGLRSDLGVWDTVCQLPRVAQQGMRLQPGA
jgi:hypothetical protein